MELACWDDIDQLGTEIENPLEGLMQDNYHRLVELPGSNIDDPDRGLGIQRLLSGNAADLISVGPRIEAELLKNPQNAEVRAHVEQTAKEEYDILIAIRPDPDELGSVEGFQILRLQAASGEMRRVQ